MRALSKGLILILALGVLAKPALAETYDERPTWQRAAFTTWAIISNIVPIASATVAPKCLPGYILCKASFAGLSLLTAGEQVVLSGGEDLGQTRAILHRGFGGDWILTGRHVAGDQAVEVLPDPGPAS